MLIAGGVNAAFGLMNPVAAAVYPASGPTPRHHHPERPSNRSGGLRGRRPQRREVQPRLDKFKPAVFDEIHAVGDTRIQGGRVDHDLAGQRASLGPLRNPQLSIVGWLCADDTA